MPNHSIGIVVIGRNEGERLRRCLESAIPSGARLVYVDSGSTDGSVQLAKSLGADVVELDMSTPFTAARARNAGVEHLRNEGLLTEFIQFVDGDCEFQPGWLQRARQELIHQPEIAAVSGRLRERFPKRSFYNQLCDMEWNLPVGFTKFFLGIVMMRYAAFEQAGCYNESLIAGEEPALRIVRNGWKLLQTKDDMAWHDANILHFKQWWRRMVRSGHAYAESAALHGNGPEHYCVRETIRAIVFGLFVPALILLSLLGFHWPWMGLLIVIVFVSWGKIILHSYRWRRKLGDTRMRSLEYGLMMAPTKIAEAVGVMKYWSNRLHGRQSRLIEYKPANSANIVVS